MGKGFGIIEIIVAMGIFIIVASTGVITVLHSFSANKIGGDTTEATSYGQEGVEAARSIKNQGWANLIPGTYGLSNSTGTWSFSGSSDTRGPFTRQILVEQVYRNANGNILSGTGGTLDPDTKKISSIVTWTTASGKQNNVGLGTWLTNWEKSVFAGWSNPVMQTVLDLPGGQDAYAVRVASNHAYVITNSASENFTAINVSDPSNLTIDSTASIPENANDLAIFGSYAYAAAKRNTEELQIIDISNPLSVSIVGTYDASGNADGQGIYSVGTTVYLVRVSSSDGFLIINASNPSSPTPDGSLDLGATGNEVVVIGNYAYIASSANDQELQVVNISNPASLAINGTYNLTGTPDALSITGFGNYIVLGRASSAAGELFIFDVSTPAAPVLRGTFSAGGNVNDVSVESNNAFAYLATEASTKEFQVVDISSVTNPTLFGSLDISDSLNGVDYDQARNRAYAVGNANNQEFVVFRPQ